MTATGFIGLGSQGGPMAERMLGAGHALTVFARRAEVAAEWRDKGASIAASVAELGAACDHIGVCVIDDAGVLSVCDDLIPAMRPGSLLAIHSTVLPETVEALAARCAAAGIGIVDAPVSGGGPGAAAGTLTVMCGASQADFDRAKPVFESFGKLLLLLGEAGAGQRAKIVNNALMAANMGVAEAALASGEALGISRGALAGLINASSGRSYGFEIAARLPTPAAFAIGAPLLLKDVGLLEAVLPGHAGAGLLSAAARPFLSAATGG